MKTCRVSLLLVAICTLFITCPSAAAHGASLVAIDKKEFGAPTEQQLASARSATAKYHDVAQAEADGYTSINLYLRGEGFHYVNFSLIDGTFDPEHPEVLLYAPVPGENRLELVGVEYLVPLGLSIDAPEGFIGDADQWGKDTEGFGLWELNAWIWLHNPEGMFSHDNPRIP